MYNITKRSNSSYLDDFNVIKVIKKKIIPYYTGGKTKYVNQTKTKQGSVQDIGGCFGPVDSKFERYDHSRSPWIDSEMWKIVQSQDRSILPKRIKCGEVIFTNAEGICSRDRDFRRRFENEVDSMDSRCWTNYTRNTRFLSTSKRNKISKAGIQSAREIGAISGNNGRKNSLKRELDFCVRSISKNTNSGYPFFGRKNNERNIKDTIHWLEGVIERPTTYSVFNNPVIQLPCHIFHRFQPSINDDDRTAEIKIRVVWCQSHRIIALENLFFHNILEEIKLKCRNSVTPVYATGISDFDISKMYIARFRDFLYLNENLSDKVRKNSLYSMDYKAYDQTIPLYAFDLWFSICFSSLRKDFTKETAKLYNILRLYLKFTPFIHKNRIWMKHTGISSGSLLTNVIDTWWNNTLWILSLSILNCLSKIDTLRQFLNEVTVDFEGAFDFAFNVMDRISSVEKHKAFCGDDVLIWTSKVHVIIHKLICEFFDMSIEIFNETTCVSDDIFFLGRFWESDNKQNQTYFYILIHLLFRTKFYRLEEVDFNAFEEINIHRTLSICTRLKNGFSFIENYLQNYKELHDFIASNTAFTLLREWPQSEDGYKKIMPIDFFNLEKV
jgi:hypothetical protein